MQDNYQDVLEVLARNDGACLYWQMPDESRAEAALNAGVIRLDEQDDLLVHPDAIKIEDGAYRMSKLTAMIREYAAWNKEQGLDLGSADEHLFDDNLTDEQRAYLSDFSRRWDSIDE